MKNNIKLSLNNKTSTRSRKSKLLVSGVSLLILLLIIAVAISNSFVENQTPIRSAKTNYSSHPTVSPTTVTADFAGIVPQSNCPVKITPAVMSQKFYDSICHAVESGQVPAKPLYPNGNPNSKPLPEPPSPDQSNGVLTIPTGPARCDQNFEVGYRQYTDTHDPWYDSNIGGNSICIIPVLDYADYTDSGVNIKQGMIVLDEAPLTPSLSSKYNYVQPIPLIISYDPVAGGALTITGITGNTLFVKDSLGNSYTLDLLNPTGKLIPQN